MDGRFHAAFGPCGRPPAIRIFGYYGGMIHQVPPLTDQDRAALNEIEEIRSDIRYRVGRPAQWSEPIRRILHAEAVRSSTQIEGFVVSTEEALDVIAGRSTPEVEVRTRLAVEDYQSAMNRVLALAEDPHFVWGRGAIRDLHYLVTAHHPQSSPGLWRTVGVGVTGPGGRLIYRAPDPVMVPPLMDEVADWLAGDDEVHPIIRGAMAHFHIAAVHPFRDGNGRTARVVQSLVLASAGRVAPAFASIERYLGDHTNDYYRALGDSQGGQYDPTSDVTPWLRFAIAAHRDEALALRERLVTAYERREFVEELLRERSLPARMAMILDACLLGAPVHRDEYMTEEAVARATAIQDLRVLVGAGLISREGGSRNIRYRASPELARLYEQRGRPNDESAAQGYGRRDAHH